jgi:hypothetical protein
MGQATYQSAVTALPIQLPGVSIPQLSKDQYRLYAELNQVIYDGGMARQLKIMQQANVATEQLALQVDLYKVRDRVNQAFFSVIMLNAQVRQLDLLTEDLTNELGKMSSAVRNGVALKSNQEVLEAELL